MISLIARDRLMPSVRARFDVSLPTDPDSLTARDPTSEATWADAYRSASRRETAWRFVKLESDHPELAQACVPSPASPTGAAGLGPPQDCVTDESAEFTEMRDASTPALERLLARDFPSSVTCTSAARRRHSQPRRRRSAYRARRPVRLVGHGNGSGSRSRRAHRRRRPARREYHARAGRSGRRTTQTGRLSATAPPGRASTSLHTVPLRPGRRAGPDVRKLRHRLRASRPFDRNGPACDGRRC